MFGQSEGSWVAGTCPRGQRAVKDPRGRNRTTGAGGERGCARLRRAIGHLMFCCFSKFCKRSRCYRRPAKLTVKLFKLRQDSNNYVTFYIITNKYFCRYGQYVLSYFFFVCVLSSLMLHESFTFSACSIFSYCSDMLTFKRTHE